MGGPRDELRFLVHSANRFDVLQELREMTTVDRYDLETAIDASRRTIVRTLEAFERRGYLREVEANEYTLTAYGRYLAGILTRLQTELETAVNLRPFLQQVDADTLGFPLHRLEHAEVTVADNVCPYSAFDRFLELRAEATTVRMLIQKIERRSIDQLIEQSCDPEFQAEILITDTVYDTVRSHPAYETDCQAIGNAENIDVFLYEDSAPLMLASLDQQAVIGVSSGERPYALLETTDEKIRQWVNEQLDTYKTQSTQVDRFD